jgi:type IV pilus assembly protein PilX
VYLPLWTTIVWSTPTASRQYTGTIQGVAALPRYIIEELPPIQVEGESAKFGAYPDINLYRVTARGVGGTQNAVVILQGTFRR